MRVNVYAEEITQRIEIVTKTIDGVEFTGIRFYLELPVTVPVVDHEGRYAGANQYRGPFVHRPGDDDSAAVTFWGKRDSRLMFQKAIEMLDAHYSAKRLAPRGE